MSLIVAATAVSVIATGSAAYAGTSAPLAFGQTDEGDNRVLGVTSTAAGTGVAAVPYQPGTGAAVGLQRWTFEKITVAGLPASTYRLRNAASGLCMEKEISGGDVNGALVKLATCALVSHQYWYQPDDYPLGGALLRSGRDHRCLDAAMPEDGAVVDVYSCIGLESQYWKVRAGVQTCHFRWSVNMCVYPSQPMFGVTANWRHHTVSFGGPDYNTATRYIYWETVGSVGSDEEWDYMEMGFQSDFDPETSNTTHNAYWLEQDAEKYEVHSLVAEPGGSGADGRNHTYMVVSNDTNQFDLYFDHKKVGTTTVAEGSQIFYAETGVTANYDEQLLMTEDFISRLQLMTGNREFRRPYLGETGITEKNTCYNPPSEIGWGYPDSPPWCWTHDLVPRGTSPTAEADRFAVAKPQTAMASQRTSAGVRGSLPGTVAKRADATAARILIPADWDSTLETTKSTSDGKLVVTGDAFVASKFNGRTSKYNYRGFRATFDQRTGTLLHLCLGQHCTTR